MNHLKKVGIVLALATSCILSSSLAASESEYGTRYISTAREDSQAKLPGDYEHIFSFAMVSKGAGGFRNYIYFRNLQAVLAKAKKENQLKPEGLNLYKAVIDLESSIKNSSPAKLSHRGVETISAIGMNFAKNRYKLLMNKAFDNEISVLFEYNGDNLSLNTGENFILGMTKSLPDNYQIIFMQDDEQTQKEVDKVLSFYNNTEYSRYLTSYPALVNALGKHQIAKQTTNYNDAVIKRLFEKEFCSSFSHRGIMFDQSMQSRIEVPDFVKYIYELYTFLPTLGENVENSYQSLFDVVMPKNEREYWASVEDAGLFYKFGPGFKNQQISQVAASKIFESLDKTLKDVSEENIDEPAKLYFVDPKTMVSFISFIKGEQVGEPIALNKEFDVTNNLFKGYEIAPINGILIWDIYRNRAGKYFVKFKFNGKDANFKASCGTSNNGLYEWEKIESCMKISEN